MNRRAVGSEPNHYICQKLLRLCGKKQHNSKSSSYSFISRYCVLISVIRIRPYNPHLGWKFLGICFWEWDHTHVPYNEQSWSRVAGIPGRRTGRDRGIIAEVGSRMECSLPQQIQHFPLDMIIEMCERNAHFSTTGDGAVPTSKPRWEGYGTLFFLASSLPYGTRRLLGGLKGKLL